ncbi:chymotrypsinogen B-like, partial [Ixodes scapularis]|uniref:chymotrypsinogen B-like n=1 Tax=Ixodes scapularis TaxID=6945 RepID=UPI001C380D55
MNSRFLIFLYATAFIPLASARLDRKDQHNDRRCNCGKRQKAKIVSSRIINGTEAPPEHWPWVVGIYDSTDTLVCGGSLINEEYVVTAEHCFANKDACEFSIRLGTILRTNFSQCINTQQDSTAQNMAVNQTKLPREVGEGNVSVNKASEIQVICVEVESICTPIQKDCGPFLKDIAVVKLKNKVNYSENIQPICLPENGVDPPTSSPAYAVGWGKIYALRYSPKMENGNLPVCRLLAESSACPLSCFTPPNLLNFPNVWRGC